MGQTNTSQPLKWGILGSGNVCNDFLKSFSYLLPSGEHEVIACASFDYPGAQKLATTFKIPKCYETYESLLQDPEVELAYIGVINPEHIRLCKLALDYGKHVFCEKPLGMNVRETKEILEYAKSKKLFLCEGIWCRHFPVYKKLKEEIENGVIGDPVSVVATFGSDMSKVDRVQKKELGGGATLDVGIYVVQFAAHVFGNEKPLKIITGGHLNSDGVDESSTTTMIYSRGRTATLMSHSKINMNNEAFVFGTKGSIKVEFPFWCPTRMTTPEGTIEIPLPGDGKDEFIYTNSAGLNYQCDEVKRCIRNGMLESPVVPHETTLHVAEIMESIRKQVGVTYSQD